MTASVNDLNPMMPARRRRRRMLLVIITVIIAVALGVGLGKGLHKGKRFADIPLHAKKLKFKEPLRNTTDPKTSENATWIPFNASTPLPKSNAKPVDWRGRSIYQVMTDRFGPTGSAMPSCDTSRRQYCGGTWQGLIDRLDYIQNMGFTAVSVHGSGSSSGLIYSDMDFTSHCSA